MISIVILFFVFIFGLIIGSFLNSVIYRFHNEESLLGRSYCPHCHHQLAWYDLIPLFSFILLKGRCRYCHRKISWQYPLVEFFTGLLFLFIFLFIFPHPVNFLIAPAYTLIYLVYLFTIVSLFIVIFVYDLKYYIIPRKIVSLGVLLILFYRLLEIYKFHSITVKSFLYLLIFSFLISFIFWLIWFLSKGKWMGLGDAKLVFFLSFFLDPREDLVALFFAFGLGAIIGLILICLKKKEMRSELPFGPFLIIGTLIALFWGERIIQWYMRI